MASNEPIYISSDEEERRRKRCKIRKHQRSDLRAIRQTGRARSLELPKAEQVGGTKRCSSVGATHTLGPLVTSRPIMLATVPLMADSAQSNPSPDTAITPAAETSEVTGGPPTNTTSAAPTKDDNLVEPGPMLQYLLTPDDPDPYHPIDPVQHSGRYEIAPDRSLDRSAEHPFDDLAIEPIQHPERYVIPHADSTAKDLARQSTENVQQPETTGMNVPYEHQTFQSYLYSDSMQMSPTAAHAQHYLNSLKRKHDQAATEPDKRTQSSFAVHPGMDIVNSALSPTDRNSFLSGTVPNRAPYYQAMDPHPRNPQLWSVPAHDPNMPSNDAIDPSLLTKPSCTPAKAGLCPTPTPSTAERQTPQPGPRRAKKWNCGIIADLGTALEKSFDANAFADKHGMRVQDIRKAFEIYVHKPLLAFSVRGQSRAMLKDLNEKLRMYDKEQKDIARSEGSGTSRRKKGPTDQQQQGS